MIPRILASSRLRRAAATGGTVPRGGALLVAAALFMEYLDGTIIANALPQIARSFGVGPVALDIGMTAYLAAVGIFIPISGWACDRFGGRRVFALAIAGFTLASLGCAASGSLWSFVACRVAQGIAAAFMTPVGRILVLRDTPPGQLVRVIALLTWPALLAPAIAPPLGGVIVEYASWRWIFLLNLPIGVIGLALVPRLLTRVQPIDTGRFDGLGLLWWSIAVIALVGAVQATDMVGAGGAALLLGTGIAFGGVAWRHFRRAARPLLDPATLRLPSFAHVVMTGSLSRTAILANPFLLPLLLQIGLGMSALRAGLFILIGMTGNIAMKFATTPILRRFDYRPILFVNGLLLGIGLAAFAAVGPETPDAWLLALLVGTGLARSMQFTALNTLAFADVAPTQTSAASTLLGSMQQINAALAVAMSALIMKLSSGLAGEAAIGLADLRLAFLFIGALCVVGAVSALKLRR